jgi:hypothetical protein
MEENMSETEQKVFVTKVVEVEGAIAVDVPPALFKRLDLKDGVSLLWTFEDDGSVRLARVAV